MPKEGEGVNLFAVMRETVDKFLVKVREKFLGDEHKVEAFLSIPLRSQNGANDSIAATHSTITLDQHSPKFCLATFIAQLKEAAQMLRELEDIIKVIGPGEPAPAAAAGMMP